MDVKYSPEYAIAAKLKWKPESQNHRIRIQFILHSVRMNFEPFRPTSPKSTVVFIRVNPTTQNVSMIDVNSTQSSVIEPLDLYVGTY